MNHKAAMVGGIGLGIGLMYLLDPAMGRRRRALLRDKAFRYWRKTGDTTGAASRDVANRARGLSEGIRSTATEGEGDDSVLEARVRSRLGHAVTHPSAISVSSDEGRITLSGDILQWELSNLLDELSGVPGVKAIDNRIAVHETAGDIPSLQGDGRRTQAARFGRWATGGTVLAGAAGGAIVYSIARARNHTPQTRWRRITSAIPRYDLGFGSLSATRRILTGAAGALAVYGLTLARRSRARPTGWRRIMPGVRYWRRAMPSMAALRKVPASVAHSIPWVS
jgi:hypothetical protein